MVYKILIVDKITKLDTLSSDELNSLSQCHRDKIRAADFEHKHTMSMFKGDLSRNPTLYIGQKHGSVECEYIFLNMREITSHFDFDSIDVFATIGGDGTALFLAKFIKDQPLVSINSNPDTSVGHICQHQIKVGLGWDLLHFQLSRAIQHVIWKQKEDNPYPLSIPRLQLMVGEKEKGVFLNDALFTNENPAEMSVYNLEVNKHEEVQRSSGLWISTAMGSTGGIHSAGVTPIDKKEKILLWKTREPYEGQGRCWYPQGHVDMTNESTVNLQSMSKGLHFYLDGSHNKIPLDIGKKATIISYQHPLNLV